MSVPSLYSRFVLLSRPLASPGKCVVCGATHRQVVDLKLDLPQYGTVYFCLHCLSEVAVDTLGMVPKEDHENLVAETGRSFEEQLTTHNLKVITDEQYAAFTSFVSMFSTDNAPVGRASDVPVDANSGDSKRKESPANDATPVAKSEKPRQDNRTSGRKRSASVPANNGDGIFNLG